MKKRERGRTTEVLLLRDLAPRQEIKGGAGKRVFGDVDVVQEKPVRPAPRKRKRK
jgi:hypothetical protein